MTSVDGLISTKGTDEDGDTLDDVTVTHSIIEHADGSRKTVAETRYADGDLRSMEEVSVSRDGRHVVERHDYDGNGLADKTSELVIRADGERILTEESFGEGGDRVSTFLTTTSSDGLITTISRGGFIQTITRSALENGNYTWDNGIANARITVSHDIDAFGIDTWRYIGPLETHEARLDEMAKARLTAEAARIYDTVLDRDMDYTEQEVLVKYVAEGELDRAALVTELMNSDEAATRYGVLTNAEFVDQFYLNTFGRAPSLVELDTHLRTLTADVSSRVELLLTLSEAVEHLVVGNTHMATNNFDVIMNPAEYERSLDRAYVQATVKDLIDVAYDRDATAHELEYYAGLLLEGTDNPDDLVAKMLLIDGAIQGVSSASLKGLSGAALVSQAFLNAFGRQPTAAEQQMWEENLSSGRISANQFIVALAQSTEKLENGRAHEANAAPALTHYVGTAAAETKNGGTGQDKLEGMGGNDTLNGGNGSDILVGGAGDDALRGGGVNYQSSNGSDIYIWSRGDGNDSFVDLSTSELETDTLRLLDVTSDEVSLSIVDTRLVISIEGTNEVLEDWYRFVQQGVGLEVIEFSDGVTWGKSDIQAHTNLEGTQSGEVLSGTFWGENILGHAGNDTISGGDGDDVLVGGAGDDVLTGGSAVAEETNGSDTYVWSIGDGNDTIQEYSSSLAEVDTLRFENVASDGVVLRRVSGTVDIEIEIQSSGEIIRVISQLHDYTKQSQGLEAIEFSDGVIWGRDDIALSIKTLGGAANDVIIGTDASDNIYGHAGNDTLDGGFGGDVLFGGAGDDVLKAGFEEPYRGPLYSTGDFSQSYWGADGYDRHFADVNGDGKSDLIGFSANHVYIGLGQANGLIGGAQIAGSDFTILPYGWGTGAMQREFADVNGDGRADVIGFSTNHVYVTLGQADGTFGGAFEAGSEFVNSQYGWGTGTMQRELADVNGDGRADVIGFGTNHVYVTLGQADGTFGVGFEAGSEFVNSQYGWGAGAMQRELADVNGDGRADIVGFSINHTYVALGQADGTFTSSFNAGVGFAGNLGNFERQIADINGDGKADPVAFAANGVFVDLSTKSSGSSLSGDEGNDILKGWTGDDVLNGGAGDDVLTGGSGADTFVFGVGSGQDVIEDFSLAEDFIRIDGQLPSFEITDTADGALLHLGDNDQVLVKGVTAAELQGSSALGPVDVAPAARLQIGDLRVEQLDSTQWHSVNFGQTIENAAVVMGPASSEGDQPLTLRVRNVTDQGFEFQVDEWDHLDGVHPEVSVSWMAGSLGSHVMADGTKLTFGQEQVSSAATSTVALSGFTAAPIVLAQLSGDAEARALTHRLDQVTASGFEFRLQAEEAQVVAGLSSIATEQLYWVALDIAAGSTVFETGQLAIDHDYAALGTTLEATEAFFADMQTFAGIDPAGLRYDLGTGGAVSLRVEEEESHDSETTHALETIAWLTANEGVFDLG
ncbi:FG-GAP-like repeat-containing protein [uncultured Roseobacter sp.]|uniref:FG-GAP-like repeat-containing protein n=1 Tax=uncultured Roseobacter sp. TaxID=114847 RepID=UPI00262905AB|nr:FG-GAP-like repeat-containing protein [uncultured Roseobacter sp.]